MTGKGVCKDVVVKFTLHRYGIAVHEFLASKSQAPKVFHFSKHQRYFILPENWHVVVMEKVEGVALEHLDDSSSGQFKFGKICTWRFTPTEYFAIADQTNRVVDFDWAGVSGVVKYPEDLHADCTWHPDVKAGAPITSCHDHSSMTCTVLILCL